jgi:hypothetical protein
MPIRHVAIVGAGLAGLACAKTLAAHGIAAKLFDKGRSAGGRIATRRVEVGGDTFEFDHGAQHLTALGPMFQAALDASGAKPWLDGNRRVGVPRMSAIPRALAQGLDLAPAREVSELVGEPGAWRLRHVGAAAARRGLRPSDAVAEDGPFDAVIVAVPAPQAARLLRPAAPHLARVLDQVVMAPCWALLAAFAERLPLPDVVAQRGGPIAWAARDSAKPGRNAEQECWVVHATAAWSEEHLEQTQEQAATELLSALAALTGRDLPAVLHAAAHRWRYAAVRQPLGAPCLWDPARQLGAAGDWCIADRAEAAVDSGAAMAAIVANDGRPRRG